MSYPEDSVGARMDFDMVTIRDDVTLEVVLRYLRRFDALPKNTDQVFVVDRDDVLKGALPIDRLLINEPDTEVATLMQTDLLTLAPLDDAGEAAQAFERYDLVSAPVVDANGRLIGRLTVDEVVDVIREESEDVVLAQAGLQEEEDLFASVWNSAKNRWLWLAVNLCTAFFASRVIGAFEGTIEQVVALATLMTIVMGIAGNSGNQTMTLMIRSLALGQVTGGNARRLIYKELRLPRSTASCGAALPVWCPTGSTRTRRKAG
jgi:magnesium transporter